MKDHLVEIKPINWPKLRNLYTPDGTKSYITFTTIDNYVRWFEQDPNLKHVKFVCLNGDFADGTFVMIDRYRMYVDTFSTSMENLKKLLLLMDYSKGYNFMGVRPEIRPVILDILHHLNHTSPEIQTTLLYFLPKDAALQFEVKLPEGITLHSITERHDYEKVNSLWPEKNPNSFAYFQRIGKYNRNVGAYKDDGELVAWLFRLPIGLLGSLQTDENFHRHGYGSLVAKYLSKSIAETGHNIYAAVLPINIPSRSLFEKLGFKSIGEIYWIASEDGWTPDDE